MLKFLFSLYSDAFAKQASRENVTVLVLDKVILFKVDSDGNVLFTVEFRKKRIQISHESVNLGKVCL